MMALLCRRKTKYSIDGIDGVVGCMRPRSLQNSNVVLVLVEKVEKVEDGVGSVSFGRKDGLVAMAVSE